MTHKVQRVKKGLKGLGDSRRMRQLNIANILTLARIGLIPIFVIFFYLPYSWHYVWTAAIFGLAAITDWLDGYIARKYEQSTKLGAFLDPVADKLMVVVALILLVEEYASPWLAIPACIIIAREVAVSALREWMAEIGSRSQVSVSFIGKAKTMAQMFAIAGLLAFEPDFEFWLVQLSFGLLYTAVALTLWSMVIYMRAAWPMLTANESVIRIDRDSSQ